MATSLLQTSLVQLEQWIKMLWNKPMVRLLRELMQKFLLLMEQKKIAKRKEGIPATLPSETKMLC